MQQIKLISLSSAWQKPCGIPPDRFQEWEAAIQCDQNKDKASAEEWQQQNGGDVTKRHHNSNILVHFIN